jgi:hypothetical protein
MVDGDYFRVTSVPERVCAYAQKAAMYCWLSACGARRSAAFTPALNVECARSSASTPGRLKT